MQYTRQNRKCLRLVLMLIFVYINVFALGNVDSLHTEAVNASEKDQARIFNELALEYLGAQEYVQAQLYAKKAINSAELYQNESEIGQAYMVLGEVFFRTTRYEKAIEFLKKAEVEQEKFNDKQSLRKTTNFLGNCYYSTGQLENALEVLNKSVRIADEIDYDRGVAVGSITIGNIYMLRGKFEHALDMFQKALNIFEDSNYLQGISTALTNIGLVYLNMESTEEALSIYQKALDIARQIGNKYGEADVLNNIGNIYGDTNYVHNDIDSAITYWLKSIEVAELVDFKKGMAASYTNMGHGYLRQASTYQDALKSFNRAEKISEEINDPKELVHAKMGLSQTYYYLGNLNKSIDILLEAIPIAEKNSLREQMQLAYRYIYRIYKEKGDLKNSLYYMEKYVLVSDKVIEQKQSDFAKAFALEQKDKEIKEKQDQIKDQELKAERNRLILIIGSTGLIIILIFAVLMLIQFMQKRKANFLLTEKNEQILMQNEEILQQKEEIEAQRNQVVEQRDLIEEQQRGIMDSIMYARRIQEAVLPQSDTIKALFPDSFVLYKPRDIVSGDFFWIGRKNELKIVVAADCTGHGVPGAFMSMLGTAFLNEIIGVEDTPAPHEILNKLRDYVISSLKQTGREGEQKDGMDVALYIIDEVKKELFFSGANNPLLLIRKNGTDDGVEIGGNVKTEVVTSSTTNQEYKIIQVKGDKMPIGIHSMNSPFSTIFMKLQEGDCLYTFSDGYVDQFGGSSGKKYMIKRFKKLLVNINDKPMKVQQQLLDNEMEEWKNGDEQIDDILVVGVRV